MCLLDRFSLLLASPWTDHELLCTALQMFQRVVVVSPLWLQPTQDNDEAQLLKLEEQAAGRVLALKTLSLDGFAHPVKASASNDDEEEEG